MDIREITAKAGLQMAYEGSYYFIGGCGDPLDEWVTGYHGLLAEEGIGEPREWFKTTGALVNDFAFPEGWISTNHDCFKPDLTVLMFSLDGLNAGKLALFKLRMQDRWFDDVIDNMRRH
jgi:hypothetical protein